MISRTKIKSITALTIQIGKYLSKCILSVIPMICHSQEMSQFDLSSHFCSKLNHCQWLENATGIQILKGGLSGDKIYKISHDDQNYILRIFDKQRQQKRLVSEIINTHIASKLPFSPNVHSFDIQSRYMLLEYLEQENFVLHNITDLQLKNLANRLATLHKGKPFPKTLNTQQRNQRLFKKLKKTGLFLPMHLSAYHISHAYLQDLKAHHLSRPSHNDLNPFNIIFHNQNFWFIDWETASMSDPFFDIATIANFFMLDQKRAYEFLYYYFDETPNAAAWIKFNIMRQVSYSHFSMKYLLYAQQLNSKSKGMNLRTLNAIYPKLQHRNLEAMLNAIYQGHLTLDTAEKLQYFSLLLLREFWKQQHFVSLLINYTA